MKQIGISVSPKQASRLRCGHKVRVKGGSLCQLIVHPDRYDSLERTFRSGKGKEIQLSPEEIQANRGMSGEGIFGPGFDKFLGKVGIKKAVYALGDVIKGPVKKAIRTLASQVPNAAGVAAASLATALGQPELALVAGAAGRKAGKLAADYAEKHSIGYIDDPEAYQKDPRKKLVGFGLAKKLDHHLGTTHSARTMAALGTSAADAMTQSMGAPQFGSGLYASSSRGQGLHFGKVLVPPGAETRQKVIVGMGGGSLHMGHPALQSQPYATHFHQQFQLPEPLQRYHKQGAGLYA